MPNPFGRTKAEREQCISIYAPSEKKSSPYHDNKRNPSTRDLFIQAYSSLLYVQNNSAYTRK